MTTGIRSCASSPPRTAIADPMRSDPDGFTLQPADCWRTGRNGHRGRKLGGQRSESALPWRLVYASRTGVGDDSPPGRSVRSGYPANSVFLCVLCGFTFRLADGWRTGDTGRKLGWQRSGSALPWRLVYAGRTGVGDDSPPGRSVRSGCPGNSVLLCVLRGFTLRLADCWRTGRNGHRGRKLRWQRSGMVGRCVSSRYAVSHGFPIASLGIAPCTRFPVVSAGFLSFPGWRGGGITTKAQSVGGGSRKNGGRTFVILPTSVLFPSSVFLWYPPQVGT